MDIIVVNPHCSRCGVAQEEDTYTLFLTWIYSLLPPSTYSVETICKNQKDCVERQKVLFQYG